MTRIDRFDRNSRSNTNGRPLVSFENCPRNIFQSHKTLQVNNPEKKKKTTFQTYGCDDSDSTLFTAAEPDGDLAKFQSIEFPCNIRKGKVDSAHLHETAVNAEGIEDNDNNRLALSPSMHRMFDDRRRALVATAATDFLRSRSSPRLSLWMGTPLL